MSRRKIAPIKELREICQTGQVGGYYRKISIYFTKLLLYTPVTANQVTLLMTLAGIASGILFSFGIYWYSIIGALIIPLYLLSDYIDGEIARYNGTASLAGAYIDRLGHMIVYPFIFGGMSFGVYNNFHDPRIFIFGYSAALFTVLLSSIEMHRDSILQTTGKDNPERAKVRGEKSSKWGFIADLLRVVGLKFPDPTRFIFASWVILAGAIFDYMYLVLIIYGILLPARWILQAYYDLVRRF
jgi:phosphatidylglycerophosphate synthase